VANLTGWEAGRRVRFFDFGERTYCCNGVNRPQCYDGVGWAYAGIENDPSLVTGGFTLSGTGLTGTYHYYVVPANENKVGINGRFVTGIPVYWGSTSPVNQAVTVAGIPASHIDPQVTHFHIYRNRNGYLDTGILDSQQPDAFFYVAHVTVGTTSYADSIADISLVDDDRIDFARYVPPAFKMAAVYAHRVFAAGMFDRTAGTVTVNTNALLIDLSGSTWPDGVLGGWFQKDGAAKRYRISRRVSTTQILLEEAYVGALSAANYAITRESYAIWYSKYLDAEGWGINGEENRYYLEMPEKQEVTSLIPFRGRLLAFGIDRCYEVSAAEDQDPDAVSISEEPMWTGLGAVGPDATCVADGFVYFLSLRGLARWSGQGQPELLEGLGTELLDAMAPTQFGLCSCKQDAYNGEIVIAVPATGQTENGLEYSYDPTTNAFWPDLYTHPDSFQPGRATNGKPCLFYSQGNFLVQRNVGLNDLAPSGTVTGTISSQASTLTATDSTASFYTTGNGLCEAYVHFFNPTTHAIIGSRRILSNTGTILTWASTGAGGGTLTVVAGSRYFIGPVWWYWKTPVMEVSPNAHESLMLHVGVEPGETTERQLYVTETRDGTDKAAKKFAANKPFEQVALLQAGHTMQIKLESRETNSIVSVRDLTIDREVRGGKE